MVPVAGIPLALTRDNKIVQRLAAALNRVTASYEDRIAFESAGHGLTARIETVRYRAHTEVLLFGKLRVILN